MIERLGSAKFPAYLTDDLSVCARPIAQRQNASREVVDQHRVSPRVAMEYDNMAWPRFYRSGQVRQGFDGPELGNIVLEAHNPQMVLANRHQLRELTDAHRSRAEM